MADFDIKGTKYRSSRIDARRQFHLLARLTPLAGAMVNAAKAEDKVQVFTSFAMAVAGMSDADRDYIIDSCLTVTQRQQTGGNWAPVMRGGTVMFDDIDPAAILEVCSKVLMENLGPFFEELRSRFLGAE